MSATILCLFLFCHFDLLLQNARVAAARLVRHGRFDRYSMYLPPEALQNRVKRFSAKSGIALNDSTNDNNSSAQFQHSSGILTMMPPGAGIISNDSAHKVAVRSGIKSKTIRRSKWPWSSGHKQRIGVIRIPVFVDGTARGALETAEKLIERGATLF